MEEGIGRRMNDAGEAGEMVLFGNNGDEVRVFRICLIVLSLVLLLKRY